MTSRTTAAVLALATLCSFLPVFAPASQAQDPATGSIRGVAYDKDFDVPLGQVRVSVVEAMASTMTDDDGHFFFERLPVGSYTLWFTKDGYQRLVRPNVVVTPGGMSEVRADLLSEVVEMDELIVTGMEFAEDSEVGLLDIRAEAVAVQDAVSAEMMSKAGASDVAGALKLVVGTSVVDGKYATVRGLSDRYTGTTLNGVRIPSPDPRRRAVQMDLFPTGTIQSITVSKTFTPDLQGDFTGGGVDIRTKSVPDGFVLSAAVSEEYNSNATANSRFLTYQGGGVPFLGSDDRKLPSLANATPPALPTFSPNPSAEATATSGYYDALTRSFDPVMGVKRGTPGPNYSFSLVTGNRFAFGSRHVLGFMAALTYARKYDFYEGGINNTAGVQPADEHVPTLVERTDARGTEELLIGGLGSLIWRLGEDHEVSLDVVRNRATEDEARLQVRTNVGGPVVEHNQTLRYAERHIDSDQLHGKHELGMVHLDWMASRNATLQDEPDVRFFRNYYDRDLSVHYMPPNANPPQNTRRYFRTIDEDNLQAGVNASWPFVFRGQEGRIKGGLFVDRSDREYEQRSFHYVFPNQVGSIFNTAAGENRAVSSWVSTEPGWLWTDVFTEPHRLGLAGNRCPPGPPSNSCAMANQLLWVIQPMADDVDYTGDQTIDAAYVMGEVPLGSRIRLTAGARSEKTQLEVVPTNKAFGLIDFIEVQPTGDRYIAEIPQENGRAEIEERDLLPAVSATGKLSETMSLRAAWTKTVARPTFRELAPVAAEEFLFGDEFFGNPDLELSDITNWDVRWEWFRRAGEVLAVSGFYKDVENPIELISFAAGGRNFIQPVNYEQGEVYGAELEARTNLDLITERLRHFSAGFNYTKIESAVDIPLGERESLAVYRLDQEDRPLLGQPEYLLNLSLEYDNEAIDTRAGLFYGVVGETLVTGAARGEADGIPDVFEAPYATLDVKVTGKIGKIFSLSLSAKNLLGADRETFYRRPQGAEAPKTERETATLYAISGTLSW